MRALPNRPHTAPALRHQIRTPIDPSCDVSVVIGSFQGAATIGATLRSLAAQSLPPERFEVIVVQNGPPDHTAKVIAEVGREHPRLVVRRLEYRMPGLGRARNAGMAMARGSYVTFVDDDDTVSPRYLETLLECSDAETVGVAQLADVDETEGVPRFDNRLARQLDLAGRRLPPGKVICALTYSVGKLMPTALARAVGFDPDLRSGEDIDFYVRFFMRYPLHMQVVPLDAHAVYYRAVVPGSMSRQEPSYDFNVTQRLEVIERLEALRPTEGWHRQALAHLVKGQATSVNRFLRERPDRYPDILADINSRGLVSIPHEVMVEAVEGLKPELRKAS